MATQERVTFEVHKSLAYSTFCHKFTKEISPTDIPFLDLIIYIRGRKLYTILHTKTTDRHMYLNFSSEHPMSLKNQ